MSVPVGPPLLLPERHGFFDSIDRLAARGECLVPVRGARCDTNSDVSDAQLADPMNRGNPDASVLRGHAFEDARHFFERKALVRFVVESGDLFSISVVANDTMEDTNATGTRVLDGFANHIDRDVFSAQLAQNDRRPTGNRGQNVDAVTFSKGLRRLDEVAVDRESHALEETAERWKPIDDLATQLFLRHALLPELERRARATRKFSCGSVEVNVDLHQTRPA